VIALYQENVEMLSRTVKLVLLAATMSSLSACWALCGPGAVVMVAIMAVGEGPATTVRRAEINVRAVVQQDGRHQAEQKKSPAEQTV
jgi:hypothetical protein